LVDKQNLQRVTLVTIPKGVDLVIDARGVSNYPALGEILAEWIKQWGAAGIVTDGGGCDAKVVSVVGLLIFVMGPAAPASLATHTPMHRDWPVGCGGVAVIPGDNLSVTAMEL
jgi:regulator of RNase E activity RraA